MATILKQKMKTVFMPTALALLISACASENLVTQSIKNEAYASSEFYINKADSVKDEEDKITYHLLAVRKLIEENKAEEAQNTFDELTNAPKLMEALQKNEVQKTEYALVSAQLYAARGNNEQAQTLLRNLPLAQLSQVQMLRFYQTQANIAENQRDPVEIVRARSMMNNYLTDNKARQENNDTIWSTLRKGNRATIEQASIKAGEIEFAGWIALITAYNQNVNNPAQMQQAMNNWRAQYPTHSATNLLPSELQSVNSYQQTQLNDIALLLPLSGEAQALGQIIKSGFDEAKGDNPIRIQVLDTDSAEPATLVEQAKQSGANLIVGPLLKDRIDSLLASPAINGVNVLALNATPNPKALSQVCYYSLSPEAEAKAAAEKMFQDGQRNAYVSAPQGDFGQRAADAFTTRWRQLTGSDADVRYYNSSEDAVAGIQSTNASQGGLYLLGTAEQVYEIKQGVDSTPLKGVFAIYTSSRSNAPTNGADYYTAMEGVKFSEIPLLADPSSDEYQKAATLTASDFQRMRLYAMGADAWLLANKFNEVSKIPGYKVSGLTGNLSAGRNCQIERSLSWMQYHNGAVEQAR